MNTTLLLAHRAYAAVKGTLALVGAAALLGLYLTPAARETLLSLLPRLSVPFAETAVAAGSIQPRPAQSALELEKQAIAEFISRRYRVAGEAASAYVATAYYAGSLHGVDPVLILAVMAIESRYNPVAESVMGAKGLMQVIPKYHLEKLSDHGGEDALLNPE
ncbi:MAG TPA: transglycosylase SLT domain-containing protein, partial [Burkholderiales bacterium]|nr:transglycosylase SLT domain-containing protein [Burkholderiales bacterium]